MDNYQYAFENIGLEPIRGGSVILLAGSPHDGTRDLAFQLLNGIESEGVITITTNKSANDIVADCERNGIAVSSDRTGIVDCLDSDSSNVPARVLTVSSVEDLTGIGMRYSKLYQEFHGSGVEHVRTGLFSVSTLLSLGEFQSVSRFVHTLVGRVGKVDGFGVLLIDPTLHDEQEIGTISQFCTGQIDVELREGERQFRARGLPDQPDGWQSF